MEEEHIFKYLNGDVTLEEQETIEGWLTENEGNLERFNQYKELWLLSAKNQAPKIDVEKAFKKVEEKTTGKQVLIHKTNYNNWWYSAAAASVILLVVVALWFSQNQQINWETENQLAERVLPDGSKIWLAPESQLSYPTKFTNSKREVLLKGKAFFEVTENKEKPFIVNGEKTQIKVLGTKFLAINTPNQEQVFLQSGKVAYYPTDNENLGVVLVPNEQAKFNTETGKLVKSSDIDENIWAWKTKKLVFKETSLQEVFPLLEEVYDIKINVEDSKYANCQLTATFIQEPVEDVWELLETIFQLEITRVTNHTFAISGNGCND